MAELAIAPKKVVAQRAPDGVDEVFIFGVIGDPWAFDVPSFLQWVAYAKPTTIRFIVMSPGGFAFDALNAVDFLKGQGITCYTEIVGECMSAATFFAALSGPDRTEITESGMFGIHKASGPIGDRELTPHVDQRMRGLYTEAYGWTTAKLDKYLDGTGTMWVGQEAVDAGIASGILDQKKVAAYNKQVERFKIEQPTAMAENTKIKVTANVKLTAGQAISAVGKNGVKAEVEIDATDELKVAKEIADQATADRIAAEAKAKEDSDAATAMVEAAKKKEEEANAKLAEMSAQKATAEKQVEEVTSKLTAETAKVTALTTERDTLKARNTELEKLPTATGIKLAGDAKPVEPGDDKPSLTAGDQFVAQVFGQMTDVQKAVHESRIKANKKATKA